MKIVSYRFRTGWFQKQILQVGSIPSGIDPKNAYGHLVWRDAKKVEAFNLVQYLDMEVNLAK